MCAEINSVKPADAEYKLQVPPAKTLVRVAVANLARRTATSEVKPGRANVQAIMRKREGNRAPTISQFNDGRASINMRARQYRDPHLPDAVEASSGSKTIACTYGLTRELGRSLLGRKRKSEFQRRGLIAQSRRIPSREIICLHSSWEVR
jgi:hypothetical protein